MTRILYFTGYPDLQSIVEPLKNRENGLKGVLVDSYVAGEMTDFSTEELRVNKIIDRNSVYGIVFGGGRLSEWQFQVCLEYYVLTNQAAIFETVKQRTRPMSVRFCCLVPGKAELFRISCFILDGF